MGGRFAVEWYNDRQGFPEHLMRARCAAWIATVGVLFQAVPTAAAQPGGDEADLVDWIRQACPKTPVVETLVRLDQVAGKAIMDRLRQGKYRTSVRLANAYLACWSQQGALLESGLFDARLEALRQIPCFVPLVIFEAEGRVDPDLARESLASCPDPGEKPPSEDERAARSWAEQVRRRMHLAAASQPPGDVLDEAERWLERMKAAGIIGPDGAARWTRGGEGAKDAGAGKGRDAARNDGASEGGEPAARGEPGEEGEGEEAAREEPEREAPDPVFAVRVLAAGAAVASGSLERLSASFGGDAEACSSMFLAALGFLQAVDLPRQAALPMILKTMVARAPLDVLVSLSDRVSRKYEDRPCAVQALVSSLALTSRDSAAVDAAVKEGRADQVVRLAAAAPSVVPVHGSPASRAAVLGALVGRLKGADRIERLCQLGNARVDGGEGAGALAAFADAAAEAPDERLGACAVEGRLRAMIVAGNTGDPAFGPAATAWLKRGPVAQEILAHLMEAGDDVRRADAVKALASVGTAKGVSAREPVLEALLKVVDDEPGSRAASAAQAAVDAAGFPEDPEGKVTWALVAGRHLATAGETDEAKKAFERAFGGLKAGMTSARGGVVALLHWAAITGRYSWLDTLMPRARAAGILTPGLAAELAGIVGEVGERERARRYVSLARTLKPTSSEEWVALADASSRIDDAAVASRDLRRAGPEEAWGADAWMVQGRIATARGLHRDAVSAYAKAMEKRPGECQPRFFHGLALLLVGDPEGAEADFAGCANDGNLGPQVTGALGYAQFDQSRFEEAEATFRRALERDSGAADNHLGLAMVLLRKGDVDGALASWSRATTLEPVLKLGAKAASRKGFVYSDVQKKAWDDLRAARAARKGGAK